MDENKSVVTIKLRKPQLVLMIIAIMILICIGILLFFQYQQKEFKENANKYCDAIVGFINIGDYRSAIQKIDNIDSRVYEIGKEEIIIAFKSSVKRTSIDLNQETIDKYKQLKELSEKMEMNSIDALYVNYIDGVLSLEKYVMYVPFHEAVTGSEMLAVTTSIQTMASFSNFPWDMARSYFVDAISKAKSLNLDRYGATNHGISELVVAEREIADALQIIVTAQDNYDSDLLVSGKQALEAAINNLSTVISESNSKWEEADLIVKSLPVL